eukprot:TRINITY_DN2590_c0_g1_i2.p1 TRINITY_DN2590_c0_g1~~TRINITY_DN2590_c0_g1_i2.p1  ORF type:complete len:314 (+),score=76.56 TRINITY_DN2590_c0_g1_i2:374-1315(+)
MPEMAALVVASLRTRLESVWGCTGMVGIEQQEEARSQLLSWDLLTQGVSRLSSGRGLDDQGTRESWAVFGRFCKMEMLVSVCARLSMERAEGDQQNPHVTVPLTTTDSVHRAIGVVNSTYFESRMLRENHADWERLKKTSSVHLQQRGIPADCTPAELLYELSSRLGMPQDCSTEEQTAWMEHRAWALVWLIKLCKQGIFASLMEVLGTAMFGEVFFTKLWGPTNSQGGHKVNIQTLPCEDSIQEFTVTASVVLTVREPIEMKILGEVPLSIQVRVMMDEQGEQCGFHMCSQFDLDKRLMDWDEFAARVAPLI